MIVSLIVATDLQLGIGIENRLLCHLPADLAYFKQTTLGHSILMGRKTYESIGRPLPKRTNMVLSRSAQTWEGVYCFQNPEEAIQFAECRDENELFVIGGAEIYHQMMPFAQRIYRTLIEHTFTADAFFPEIPKHYSCISEELREADEKNPYSLRFQVFEQI